MPKNTRAITGKREETSLTTTFSPGYQYFGSFKLAAEEPESVS